MTRAGEGALLVRGSVLTIEPEVWSDAVLFHGDRVVATGAAAREGGAGAAIVDLAPEEIAFSGFADDHIHLLAMAAARCSVDAGQPSLRLVLDAIAGAAKECGAGAWIRAVGYDEALLEEGRHPSRTELDAAAGGRPAVLHHRTGHAAVLNSAALEALGIPHHPDGLLVDRHDLLRGVPPLPEKELLASLDVVLDELASVGIVSVTDATHTNDRTALELLGRPPRVAVKAMVGWDRLDGVHYGAEVGGVGVGAAKIMPAREGGALTATGDKALLAFAVASAHHAGFPVAIHVMDIDTMADALDALSRSSPPLGTRDRIEHCSLALPEQLDALARLRVDVVTQPSFINRRAAKYREQISAVEQEWLWPLASLGKRGVPVRYSSDAPVVLPRPMEWLAAAMRREINSQEEVSWVDALKSAAAGPLLAEKQGSLVIYDRNAEAVRRLR